MLILADAVSDTDSEADSENHLTIRIAIPIHDTRSLSKLVETVTGSAGSTQLVQHSLKQARCTGRLE